MPTVLKLGGSLSRGSPPEALLREIAALAGAGHRLVVVPGGGVHADAVRRLRLGRSAGHWLAVRAMDRVALQLAARLARLRCGVVLVRRAVEVERASSAGRIPVLAPFTWLRASDPLPHGWHVTSDSIAAWVAAELRAPRLVLLKSADGVFDAGGALVRDAASTALGDLVDEWFPRALSLCESDCWIVNGRLPERLRAVLQSEETVATRVHRCASAASGRAPC